MAEYDSKVTPWQVNEQDFPRKGSLIEKQKFLLRYAILAPSSHNSQPWKFHIRDDEIDVFVDRNRWLRVADSDQRELHISVGCALENLLIAAEYFGHSHQEKYFPEGKGNLIATVKIRNDGPIDNPRNVALFEQIPKRYTNHNVYETRKIPQAEMAKLHACIYEEDFWLFSTNEARAYTEEELRQKIDEMITRADAIQFSDKAYKEELASWIGQGVFGASWLMAKISQLAVTYLNISNRQKKKDSERILSAPSLVALSSATNDRKSQVIAGQIFERIALTTTSLGLAIHPMSQILEVDEIKAELRELLEVPEVKSNVANLSSEDAVFPLQTFRLGYAEAEKGHTPRRPLEEVII